MNAKDRERLLDLLDRKQECDLDLLECIELNELLERAVDDAERGMASLEKNDSEKPYEL